jgi:cytochrome c oxidase subunit II
LYPDPGCTTRLVRTTERKYMLVPRAAARGLCAGRVRSGIVTALTLLVSTLLMAGCEAGSDYPQTTFRPVTAFGDALNVVFYNTLGWTMGVMIVVFGLILYATFRFRERPEAPHPEQVHGHTGLEITWTVIPALIVVLIGVPTVQTIFDTQRRPPDEALVVEVIGHQWWWEFRYPELGIVTANEMWVPTGRPVSLQMHSADVVHSFWIPRLGGKRDTQPLPRRRAGEPAAHKNYLLFNVRDPGQYLGQCAEFCGESHAIMRMTLNAVEPAEFDAWANRMLGTQPTPPLVEGEPQQVAGVEPGAAADTAVVGESVDGQPPAVTAEPVAQPRIGQMPVPTGVGNPFRPPFDETELLQEGERIFLSSACVACHAVTGTTAVGVLGPSLTMYGQRPWVGAGAAENSRENLIRWIRDPQSMKPGTLMPGTLQGAAGMPPTNLTDDQVRAVAAYLLSLR